MAPPPEIDPFIDTRKAIVEATSCALSKHGYTDLYMRDIDEFALSSLDRPDDA